MFYVERISQGWSVYIEAGVNGTNEQQMTVVNSCLAELVTIQT